MPAFANMGNFRNFVAVANPNFERWKRSSLRPLIAVLENQAGTPRQVVDAIADLPQADTKKYRDPLHYVLATYPGLPQNAADFMNIGVIPHTNAARYLRTPMPPNFHPFGQQADRVYVQPPSAFTNRTLEQFILSNRRRTGVVMVHLSDDDDAGMDTDFDGRTCLAHMHSVLRVARWCGLPLSALSMNPNRYLNPILNAEFIQCPNRIATTELATHTGTHIQAFRQFAERHENLVVMGFDASVCVFANVFGANDKLPDLNFRPPLVTLANVVMSRAALATAGPIQIQTPTFGVGEYGPLANI